MATTPDRLRKIIPKWNRPSLQKHGKLNLLRSDQRKEKRMEEERSMDHLATKDDVQDVRDDVQNLSQQVARLEGQVGEFDKRLATKEDLEKSISTTRSDLEKAINDVQIELAQVKTSLGWIKWILLTAITLGSSAWIKFMFLN